MRGKHQRKTHWRRWSLIAGVLPLVLICGPAGSASRAAHPGATGPGDDPPPPDGSRAAIEKVVADYVGLYAAATLERWKSLFHPRLTVIYPAEDGTIRVRSLEEFFAAQRDYFATGRKIGERLENVQIDEGRRIARVSADFVFVDEGEESRGRLGLHLAEGKDGWRIVAIIFSYDQP